MRTVNPYLLSETEDRRPARRGDLDQLVALADSLPRAERELIEAVYVDGRSMSELARLARVTPRTMQRRVQRIRKRTQSHYFRYFALQGYRLPADVRPVGQRLLLEGLSLRATATLTRLTLHEVRQRQTRLLALIDAHIQARSAPGGDRT